jgi:hypothetical protein
MKAGQMSDIDKQIAAIEMLLETTDPDDPTRPALEARLAKLRARYKDAAPPVPAPVQSGGVNMGSAPIERIDKVVGQDDVAGDKVLGDKHEHYYGAPDTPDRATLLREYLRTLVSMCNRLSLADADSSDPTRAAVELAAVYTGLEVATTVDLADEERPRRPRAQRHQRTALEVVGANLRLVLLGEPGSGKSTVANFLGMAMAHASLGEAGRLEQLGAGWTGRALLPIHIALREFAAWIIGLDQCPLRGEVSLLWRWLEHTYGNPALVAQLRQEIGKHE